MKKYRHLRQEERTLISHYHDNGISIGEIGRRLGRNKSSISREVRRNSNKDSDKPDTARQRYLSRRKKLRRIDSDASLKAYILERLHEGFTPELIALRLKTFGELEGVSYINHESIHQWIYQPSQKKLKLPKFLPCCHARRGRRKRAHRGRIPDRTPIQERPEMVNARKEVGHWEADLMSFRGNTQHMLVIHERVTRYTVAIKLESKTAAETLSALLNVFESLPETACKICHFR
jgi:IS30 family transposase